MKFRILSGLLLILTLAITPAFATDARMQVDVLASDDGGPRLNELHANIQQAAELALSMLWNRIIPRQARGSIPRKVNVLRFMQRATPTNNGVSITFHNNRVLNYLKSNDLPYIEREPVWNLSIQLRNESGRAMSLSSSLLLSYAEKSTLDWGYKLDDSGHSLILQWQWLDQEQVNLTVRGTSRLGEFSETRLLATGDPLPQLEKWLTEVLLKARDAHAGSQEEITTAPALSEVPEIIAEPLRHQETASSQLTEQLLPTAQNGYFLLSMERHASLPEQVLFEDDLKHDPRIINLSLRQVNRDMQQYRLQLKGSDHQWLIEWFEQRGLELSQTREGWVAR
jgi:hypothetical protein